jgi:hypothetical protein
VLLPTLSKKIRPLSKKFGPFVKIASLIPFSSKYDKIFETLPVPKSVKILDFFMFHMGKTQRKQNVSNIWPLFGHFWENSATDLYGRLHATKP